MGCQVLPRRPGLRAVRRPAGGRTGWAQAHGSAQALRARNKGGEDGPAAGPAGPRPMDLSLAAKSLESARYLQLRRAGSLRASKLETNYFTFGSETKKKFARE